jgi:hypothetical protein
MVLLIGAAFYPEKHFSSTLQDAAFGLAIGQIFIKVLITVPVIGSIQTSSIELEN